MLNIATLTPFLPVLPGLAGAAIAWSVYRLAVVQRQDAWLRTLWDFHRAFWQDEKMEKVRSWIASDEAYKEVQPILAKRVQNFAFTNADAPAITIEEYKSLELIDRFAALLIGYNSISPTEHLLHRQAKQRFYDSYWIIQISETRRPEMHAYLKKFFPELLSAD